MVLIAAVALAGVAYAVCVEIYAALHRAEFAARPEVENWALPYVGTAGPSLVAAVGVFLIVAAVGTIVTVARTGAGGSRSR